MDSKGSSASRVVTFIAKKVPKYRKKWFISLVSISLLIMVALGAVAWYAHTRNERLAAETICETPRSVNLMRQASTLMNQNILSQAQLTPIVQQIKQLPTYTQDPSCLFVVDNYYAQSDDPTLAKIYLNDFNNAYKNYPHIYPSLLQKETIAELKAQVASTQSVSQQNSRNTIVGKYP